MNYYLAVDIGGTQLRAALFPEGETVPVQQERIPTQGCDESAVDRLLGLIGRIWPHEGKVSGIGMAAPGPLSSRTGIVFNAPNIPGWINLPLRKIVSDHFGVPVALENDANLAVLGEWKFGAGKGHHNVVYMTISTGIGGGVINDDHLVLGENGLATELGHVIILPGGPLCSCGKRGHLEAISSGTGIANYVVEEIDNGAATCLPAQPRPTSKEIAEAARQGDPLAVTALNRAGVFLGMALANYLAIFNPSMIIFGGGVSRTGSLLFNPMKDALAEYVFDPGYLKDLKITTVALGDNSGLLGALALAQQL